MTKGKWSGPVSGGEGEASPIPHHEGAFYKVENMKLARVREEKHPRMTYGRAADKLHQARVDNPAPLSGIPQGEMTDLDEKLEREQRPAPIKQAEKEIIQKGFPYHENKEENLKRLRKN